jgi:heme/copper-type cytochrome/quinol oxidase subunit 1
VLGIGPAAALLTPVPFILYEVPSFEFRQLFTWLMAVALGFAPAILLLFLLPGLIRQFRALDSRNALFYALLMSVVLFAFGGVLGLRIEGVNTVIPAHYHGSIVGVTLALMGLAYYVLPRYGCPEVIRWKLAKLQPLLYGVGQLIHIGGLAAMGGYGALRKTAGMEAGSGVTEAKLAAAIMGSGAGLAILGGLLFVIVMFKAWLKRDKHVT